ncbi:carbohydrate sulfotransferase 3-like [Cherax quadricarinatus]
MALKVKIMKGLALFGAMMLVYYTTITIMATYLYATGRVRGSPLWEMVNNFRGEGYEEELMVLEKAPEEPAGELPSLVVKVEETSTGRENIKVQEKITSSPSSPLLVLLLSSMPRGGSTLLTEMLSTKERSITFFEPLWPLQKKKCIEDEQCVTQYLADVFACNYNPDFERWLKTKDLFLSYFSSDAKECTRITDQKAKELCLKKLNLREMCLLSPIRIIKVIRARMAWMKNLLSNNSLDLKIIHLIRDPRGSLYSISKFKDWNKDPHERCLGLQEDLQSFDQLSQEFPTKLLQVKYENLSLHPHNVSKDILQFLYGDGNLPEYLVTYISTHMTNNSESHSMSTTKESKKQYEAWRFKMPQKMLKAVQDEPTCLYSIKYMQHTLFKDQKHARNSSISLFVS